MAMVLDLGQMRAALRAKLSNPIPQDSTTTELNRIINEIYSEIAAFVPQAVELEHEFAVVTVPQVTGNVTAIGGQVLIVTAADIGLDRRYIDSRMRISGQGETYILRDVLGIATGPYFISPAYSGAADGVSSGSVSATFDQLDYIVPENVLRVESIRISNTQRYLDEVDIDQIDISVPDPQIRGLIGAEPRVWAWNGQNEADFWGTDIGDSIAGETGGLVNVTNDSFTIAMNGSSTPSLRSGLISNAGVSSSAFASYLIGKWIKVEGDTRSYRIKDYTFGAAQANDLLVLEEPYRGTTATGVRYVIQEKASGQRIRVYPVTTTALHLNIRAKMIPPALVDDRDAPRLVKPYHHVLMKGARALAMFTFEEDEVSLAKATALRREYLQALTNYQQESNSIRSRVHRMRPAWASNSRRRGPVGAIAHIDRIPT